ncbi:MULTISPECIES: NAD(P)/FAD-dependent oxidoreductase [Pseudochrobactrum]|uniref:NAD(P)/FAD-dependent oxidoreductase n=1 Tax=Pseudochrobactrum TaxID=354349 RepID=UPI003528351A
MAVSSSHSFSENKKHIAVIGSGISGLSAAWLLSKTARVTIYEENNRLGGHSNTIMVPCGQNEIAVDTGFIVYNERNYPNLVALFETCGVETQKSNMSFAVSLNEGGLEYSGSGINGLLGQRRNIIRPRFWFMVRDVLRFYREAPSVLDSEHYAQTSLGEYLRSHNYGNDFVENHLLSMGAAIWSAGADEMRAYPVQAFVRFFVSHGLLSLKNRPQWRTVTGGSRRYVERLAQAISGDIRLDAKVVRIKRTPDGVMVTDNKGHTERFTDVVIAAHADQALAMLDDPSFEEQKLLGAFRYTANSAVLHSDTSLMPRRRRIWSSWNYTGDQKNAEKQPLCVTYWMNKLQSLDKKYPLFVTLNPTKPIVGEKIIKVIDYEHPLFDLRALEAQRALHVLQGKRNTWFCGAYFGYGFHEDGLQAGLAVAEGLAGLKRPWNVPNASSRISQPSESEAS